MAAMAHQHELEDSDDGKDCAIESFLQATQESISADRRMINRDDIGSALEVWKMDVQPAWLSHIKQAVKKNGNIDQLQQKDLMVA
jgi:hypothetical protein